MSSSTAAEAVTLSGAAGRTVSRYSVVVGLWEKAGSEFVLFLDLRRRDPPCHRFRRTRRITKCPLPAGNWGPRARGGAPLVNTMTGGQTGGAD